jgi:uncharacterized protein YprB with RNaseH-like and TPR domain
MYIRSQKVVMSLIRSKNHLKEEMTLALGVERGTLIDIETTGLPKDKEHDIVSFGYITSNKLVVIGRRSKEKAPYYRELRELIRRLPKPLYAYNALSFERLIIEGELGLQLPLNSWVDLMVPWRIKADTRGLKWPALDELISEPEKYFGEEQIRGKDCPGLWKAYLSTGSERMIELIMQHNLSDLLRETILLLLHPELYEYGKY